MKDEILWVDDEQAEKNKLEMLKVYKDYPLVGDYDVDPNIFKPEIIELIKQRVEDDD